MMATGSRQQRGRDASGKYGRRNRSVGDAVMAEAPDALDILLGFHGAMWDCWSRRFDDGLAELRRDAGGTRVSDGGRAQGRGVADEGEGALSEMGDAVK